MFVARSVTLVYRRLRNDDRPFGVPPPYRTYRIDDSLLLWIKRAHRDNEKVRLVLAKCQVFGWIVARLPDPARIEKPDERCLLGKVKNARRFGAGLEAISYLGSAAFCHHAYDRRLTRLHLAQEPDHGSKRTRTLRNFLISALSACGEKHRL
jgi:hypothetical protein